MVLPCQQMWKVESGTRSARKAADMPGPPNRPLLWASCAPKCGGDSEFEQICHCMCIFCQEQFPLDLQFWRMRNFVHRPELGKSVPPNPPNPNSAEGILGAGASNRAPATIAADSLCSLDMPTSSAALVLQVCPGVAISMMLLPQDCCYLHLFLIRRVSPVEVKGAEELRASRRV